MYAGSFASSSTCVSSCPAPAARKSCHDTSFLTRSVGAVRRRTTTRSTVGASAIACETIPSSGTSFPLRYVTSVANSARAPARRIRSPSAPAPKPANTTRMTTPIRIAPSIRTIASAERGAARGPSRSRLSPRALALPQLIALDLPGHRLRKLGYELDPARVLIRSDAPLHEGLELVGELVRGLLTVLQQNEGLGFDELVLVLRADDSALEHLGMLHERGLDLGRRDPLPRYLEHVVAAPLIGVVAVLIEVVLVACDVPLSFERGLRLLVLVPVVRRTRVPGDPQISGLALVQVRAVIVDDLRAVPRHGRAARASLRFSRVVRDEDVQHLGGADAVEYFEPETVLPLIEERFRKRLSGADAHTQRGQVEPEILLGIREERRVEGRRGEEDRRLLLRDERVDELGRGALRLVDARGTDREREEDAVPQAVRVEQRRDGEMAVVLGRAQNLRAIRVRAIDHVVLQVDRALRKAGRAGRIEPEAGVVGCGVGGRELIARRCEELFERQHPRRLVSARGDDVRKAGHGA